MLHLNDLKYPLEAFTIGKGGPPELKDLQGESFRHRPEYGPQQILHLGVFDQEGIVSVKGTDFPIGNIASGPCQLPVGFPVLGCGEKQI